MKNKKSCALGVGIAGCVLLIAVVLFVSKSTHGLASNDHVENMVTEESRSVYPMDEVEIVMDYSTVFESE